MNELIFSLSVLGAMGVAFGIILAYASKKLAVWKDPKIGELEEILPGLNCGACGYAGCSAYAEALAAKKADPDLCKPGASKATEAIGKILGLKVEGKEPMVAQRYCNGGSRESKVKFNYEGLQTCKAASLVNNGFKACSYSCLGLGDCSLVCPVNAITMDENNIPQINKETCIGCEKCVIECPRNILHMAPKKSRVHVRCSSNDKGPVVFKVCTVGCIACRKCEKECPVDAIHVIDNLAVIDYSKCISCGKCVKVCPRNIIEQEPIPKKKEEKKKESDAEEPAEENK